MKNKRSIFCFVAFWPLLCSSISGVEAAPKQEATLTERIHQIRFAPELLIPVGDQLPTDAESQELLNVLTPVPDQDWFQSVQQFIDARPHSPWTPSLRSAYAYACRDTGRMTPALEHWEKAWEATREYKDGNGKRVADFTLANYVELLSRLGRVEKLKQLLREERARVLVEPVWQQKWDAAKEVAHVMMTYPGMAYRCGTFALKSAASVLNSSPALHTLVDEQSPPTGFTMAALATISERLQLGLVPARRIQGSEIPVPSVVHWKQDHYAAIVERRDDLYHVVDPTFGGGKWMTAEVIHSEASGNFLVQKSKAGGVWRALNRLESEKVIGKGYPNNIDDAKDEGCKKTAGGKSDPCPPCVGMPMPWVSEPYINLWMADEPLRYKGSDGNDIAFRLQYKQRDTRPSESGVRVPPTGWNHNWSSYIFVESTTPWVEGAPQFSPWKATLYLPNGGARTYSAAQRDHEETRTRLETLHGGTQAFDGNETAYSGFRLIHPDGSQDIYGLMLSPYLVMQGQYLETEALLTASVDRFGNTNRFVWGVTNLKLRVEKMIDYDGRTNTLRYTNNNLLAEVEDPYGKVAKLQYDSNKNLTNIVDAAQLSTALKYNDKGWPTNMTTPYGTTIFAYIETPADGDGNFGGHDRINRAVKITEPNGSKQLSLYRYDSTFMDDDYPSAEVPSGTPLGTLDDGSVTNAFGAVSFRNSFYWGRKQYSELSTENALDLTAGDYLRARMRHWLQDTEDLYVSGTLSIERDPSPNGSSSGAKTFFDYPGKTSNSREGTSSIPAVVSRVLPNSETQYEWIRYNKDGFPTNVVTTFTLDTGGVGTRTNVFVYGTNISRYARGSQTNSWTIFNVLLKVVDWNDQTVATFGEYETNTYVTSHAIGTPSTTTTTCLSVLPKAATNALGEVTRYTFGPRDRVSSIKTAAGLTTTNIFDSGNFVTKSVDLEISRTNQFAYTNGQLHISTDERGLKMTNSWDGLLRLTRTLYPDGAYTSNRYEKLDLAATRDRRGNWTSYGFNAIRQLVAETNALDHVTRYGYGTCGCGDLETITNALNQVTTITYDQQLRPTVVAFPDGSQLTRQYDLIGQITNVLDGANNKFSYAYNHQGLVTTISNSFGKLLSRVYDRLDRPTQVTDANGVNATNTFDALDRITSRGYPDGGIEKFGFSSKGLVAITNQLSQITRVDYDAARRLIALTNANLEVTRYGYDPAGTLTNLLDGKLQSTRWKLDSFGRVTNKVDDAGDLAASYTYDAGGNVTSRSTPEKGTTTFAYDAVNNLTNIDYPASADIRLAYDGVNRLTNVVDATGTNAFTYTAVGQLASEDGPWANDTVSYGYSQQLRTNLSLSQPNASPWSQAYVYDGGRRLHTLTSPAGTFGYAYPAAGGVLSPASALVEKLSLPNGAYITNAHDAVAQLTGTWLKNSSHAILNRHEYQHDRAGQRTNTVRLDGSYAAYAYDNIGQLKTATGFELGGAPRLHEKFGYAYDAAQNLNYRTNNSLVQTLNVDSLNQLTTATRSGTLTVAGTTVSPATSVTVNGLTANRYADNTFAKDGFTVVDGTNSFTASAQDSYGRTGADTVNVYLPATAGFQYDGNGNLISDGTKGFEYDDENQLVRITATNSWKTEFSYDGFLRRRVRKEYTWSSGSWVLNSECRYTYDGMLPIQERDGNNIPQVTYSRGLDFSSTLQRAGGIGGMLARTDAAGTCYYDADGGGNITTLINNQQISVAKYLYDPFGKLLSRSGPLAEANTFRFSSKDMHDRSGLYHYGYRYYEPTFQRWLNRDPIQEGGGINLYQFAYNNPISYFDDWGNQPGLPPGWSGPDSYDPNLNPFGAPAPSADDWRLLRDTLAELFEEDYGTAPDGEPILGGTPPIPSGLFKPSLTACKNALKKVHDRLGKLPKWKKGKWGSPQRGGPDKGYRLDPGHPNRPPGDPEAGPHFNWWDWTKGKKGSGGQRGAEPIVD
jgi:RHS repeat-associated protein